MDRDIIRLISEYLTGELDPADQNKLTEWLEEKEENRLFFLKFCSDRNFCRRWEKRSKIEPERAIRTFDQRTGRVPRKIYRKKYLVYAAMLLLLLSIGGGWFTFWPGQKNNFLAEEQAKIEPGSPKALLVLTGGKQIHLDNHDSLIMESDKGLQLVNKNSRLVYEPHGVSVGEYHELIVPKGGEYQVVLSDGSIVHLNSASSLKYPAVFDGAKREVVLTGEGYFEVAKNDSPFYVHVADMTVKVYGTIFNINGYQNRIRTALVEGKVGIQVKDRTEEYILQPSHVAEFDVASRQVNIEQADLTPDLAWTKGLLVFNNETLEQILYTLSLWYDMEVFYQNAAIKTLHFTGCVKRYDRIDIILKALSQSVGVKFTQQGKALIVSR